MKREMKDEKNRIAYVFELVELPLEPAQLRLQRGHVRDRIWIDVFVLGDVPGKERESKKAPHKSERGERVSEREREVGMVGRVRRKGVMKRKKKEERGKKEEGRGKKEEGKKKERGVPPLHIFPQIE